MVLCIRYRCITGNVLDRANQGSKHRSRGFTQTASCVHTHEGMTELGTVANSQHKLIVNVQTTGAYFTTTISGTDMIDASTSMPGHRGSIK
jgi:hypothetical protein